MSTTFDRIVRLYDQARQLLDKEDGLTDAEQTQFAAIRDELDQLWPKRRAELVFAHRGPPRMLGGGGERDQQRFVRQFARGIQPLPQGGD